MYYYLDMSYTKYNLLFVGLLLQILWYASGHPITNTEDNLINKNEKRYPNGTVIGKYSYADNEGNPIYVRYYADNAGYGVELKSIKVMSSEPSGTEKLSKYPVEITEHPFEIALDPFTGLKDLLSFNKNLTRDPLLFYKDKLKGDTKNNAGFEIMLQNEVKAPEKCGKEKVKVYFDKDKRKTREASIDYGSMNYCNRV